MDPNVDDARLLKRSRLYRAAWPFAQDSETTRKRDRYAEFVAWAKANGFDDMNPDNSSGPSAGRHTTAGGDRPWHST